MCLVLPVPSIPPSSVRALADPTPGIPRSVARNDAEPSASRRHQLAQFGPESGALLPGGVIAWSVWCAEGARTKARPCDRPLPRCSLPWHRIPIGCSLPHPLPLARCQCATEEDPHHASPRRSLESGADDTEAMSAGRWDHLSRLTEASTRLEVTETTRCDATPRHHRRQTAKTVRTRTAHGQAPAEARSIEKRGSALERY
jgi:hypothetical protein